MSKKEANMELRIGWNRTVTLRFEFPIQEDANKMAKYLDEMIKKPFRIGKYTFSDFTTKDENEE